MKDWHKLKPELFRKQPYHLPGCDTYRARIDQNGKVDPKTGKVVASEGSAPNNLKRPRKAAAAPSDPSNSLSWIGAF
jgi:hypothetical protein